MSTLTTNRAKDALKAYYETDEEKEKKKKKKKKSWEDSVDTDDWSTYKSQDVTGVN
jgi:hypothetical protein